MYNCLIFGLPKSGTTALFYAIKKIQELEPKARIIAVTADTSSTTEEKLKKLNVPVIQKPFNIEHVISSIND